MDTEKGGFASGISATDTEPGTSETEKQTHPIDSIIDRVLQVKRKASRISENIDIHYHKAGSFALTGEPISQQMQGITKRLAAGETVQLTDVLATPEVRWAEENQLRGLLCLTGLNIGAGKNTQNESLLSGHQCKTM